MAAATAPKPSQLVLVVVVSIGCLVSLRRYAQYFSIYENMDQWFHQGRIRVSSRVGECLKGVVTETMRIAAILEEHPYPKVCRSSKCKLSSVQFLEYRDLEGRLKKEARVQDDLKARG